MSNGMIDEFTLNSNGVRIKKCCASCVHHEPYDSEGPRRSCKKHTMVVDDKVMAKIVDKSDCCGDWSISKAIDKIKVRRPAND